MTRFVFALLTLIMSAATGLWAQGGTSLRGVVTDPQKAAISSAKLTLTDVETRVARSTVTSPTGEYQFFQLRPGTYSLVAEFPGFATRQLDGIRLLVDTPANVDVGMELASTSTTVSVTAEITQVNTVDATVGNTFQEVQIRALPLQTRNVVQLLSLQPGVTQNGEVMGGRRDQNNILLDGIDNNDNQNPLSGQNGNTGGFNSALPIPLDSIQEFRVTVAGQNAFNGRSSGGQVSLVTRSGTNTVHGSAYEYNRNTAFTANDWFNNRSGVPRPQLIRNQFGATLGGPIKKDKAFFFMNYETRLDSRQSSQSRTVPSESLKQGIVKFKTTNGTTYSVDPAAIAAIDPLHAGVSSTMLSYLQQYPVGNNPAGGSDQGLNFSGFIFNAPVKLDYRTYIAKYDWIMDNQGRHMLSFRGTLSNNAETRTAAQFPGQDPASQLLSDNRGFGIRYTATLSPTLINTANVGLTRIGFEQTGAVGPSVTLGATTNLTNFSRASARINPVWNLSDELTWVKGRHTLTGGVNFRWFDNRLLNYSGSFPSYTFSRGVLSGLGNDIYNAALTYVANGDASLKLANSTAVTNAFGSVLGLLNSYSATYQFDRTGKPQAFGVPRTNDFITSNYEFYIQDSWKINPKLTVTAGLHYELDRVPFEESGTQVTTSPDLGTYFAMRAGAQAAGIPGNQLPNADRITYDLNGPVNGKDSWYKTDKNNFAPRLAVAYQANKTTVFRAGAAVAFDQYGNDLVANYASTGSLGLSTTLANPVSYNFTTSPRYGAGVLPALPAAPAGGFPYTPGNITAISGTYYGIMPDLKAPYGFQLNASVQKELPSHFALEVGYVGRLSRASLIQQDIYSPFIYFKDPKSGLTLNEANTTMRTLFDSGVTGAAAKANPSLVPLNAFVEDQFPAFANYYFPGSASANYFNGIFGANAGSTLDLLHLLDRTPTSAFPNCISISGCYTYFAPQGSSNTTWTNNGNANYHGMIVTLRHAYAKGLTFDFNYTWSHSIDNGSTSASDAGRSGGVLQNAFITGQNRGSSDFDFRHLFNANVLYELPFGKNKTLLRGAPVWLDEIVGGWQISSLIRIQSGAPRTIAGTGTFNTNYWSSTQAIPKGPAPETGLFFDNLGNPSIFRSTAALSSYQDAYPGNTGTRGLIRLPWQQNADIAIQKSFKMPWENHSLFFRAEAFNAFNNVNFTGISLSLSTTGTFGEFSTASDARVMQLALRYSF